MGRPVALFTDETKVYVEMSKSKCVRLNNGWGTKLNKKGEKRSL